VDLHAVRVIGRLRQTITVDVTDERADAPVSVNFPVAVLEDDLFGVCIPGQKAREQGQRIHISQ